MPTAVISRRRGARIIGRSVKRAATRAWNRSVAPVRRSGYFETTGRSVVNRALGRSHETIRRVEIGSGFRPQPGYFHIDTDSLAPHVEAFAPAWNLPLPNDWADEILAIHVLEHVHPRRLQQTLSEWHRVLRPGGCVRIHVPDSRALMEAFLQAGDSAQKWPLIGAILGMYASPAVSAPEQLEANADHQVLFDAPLLIDLLRASGFSEVADRTQDMADVHTAGWESLIPRISLVLVATKA
jgi:SAM-dependent methyltransferase